jgi:peroxiredoxin
MAQLRQDYDAFVRRGAEVLVIGPESAPAFAAFWSREELPFVGLPDPEHTVLKLYGQEIRLFRFGRMPAQVMVDKESRVRYAHYGHAMSDIPHDDELLAVLDELNS